MADRDDLIKYITQRVVTYIDTPKEQRKQLRSNVPKESWSYRWFGMLGMSLEMWLSRRRNHK